MRILALGLCCTCWSILTGSTGRADDHQYKLQPLKYNHPGLAVDLGVGLWAWPMPMDYNGDGKLDLLVACPDKPSNGVWYFENIGQPGEKLPRFKPAVRTGPNDVRFMDFTLSKPAVRLGPASHNMQVSYVDGQPRILVPGANTWISRIPALPKPLGSIPSPTSMIPPGGFGPTCGGTWTSMAMECKT